MKQILSFCLIITTFYTYSQKNNIPKNTILYNIDSVTISSSKAEYSDIKNGINQERYYLKFENNTANKIQLIFSKELHYGKKCYGCKASKEMVSILTIPAHTTLEYDKQHKDKRFYIFIKDNNGFIKEKLTSYAIRNVKITVLK